MPDLATEVDECRRQPIVVNILEDSDEVEYPSSRHEPGYDAERYNTSSRHVPWSALWQSELYNKADRQHEHSVHVQTIKEQNRSTLQRNPRN